MHISKMSTKEEVLGKVVGMFFQAVVVTVLLYDSKTWCLLATTRRPLNIFNAKATRRLTVMMPHNVKDK